MVIRSRKRKCRGGGSLGFLVSATSNERHNARNAGKGGGSRSVTFQRHCLKGRVHRHLFGGGKLHPLIRLAVNSSSAFSHDADVCTGEM